MRVRILVGFVALVLAACSDVEPTPTGTAAPTPGDCAQHSVRVTTAAPRLVLGTGDVPLGLHQISAQPINLDSLPKTESDASNSYEVVYTDTGNTRRIVSEVVVADTASNAGLLYDGTLSLLTDQNATDLGALPLCDTAQISSVMNNGKLVYVVSWHHGNVFAEVVVLHNAAPASDIRSETEALATVMDGRISDAATGH